MSNEHETALFRLVKHANDELRAGRVDEAERESISACDLALDQLNSFERSVALGTAAAIYARRGNTLVGIGLQRRAIANARLAGDQTHVIQLWSNLGGMCANEGDHAGAIGAYAQFLRELEQVGSWEHPQAIELEGTVAHTLATLHFYDGEFAEAERMGALALDCRRQLNERTQLADTLVNLGDVYSHTQRHSLAAEHYEAGVEIYRDATDDHGTYTIATLLLAQALHRAGRFNEAVSLYHFVRRAMPEARTLVGHGIELAMRGALLEPPDPPVRPTWKNPLAVASVELGPRGAPIWERMVRAFAGGQYATAVTCCCALVSLGVQRHDLFQILLWSLARLGRADLWARLADLVLEASAESEWYSGLLGLTLGSVDVSRLVAPASDQAKLELALVDGARLLPTDRAAARRVLDHAWVTPRRNVEWALACCERTAGGQGDTTWSVDAGDLDALIKQTAIDLSVQLAQRRAATLVEAGRHAEALGVLDALIPSLQSAVLPELRASSIHNQVADAHFRQGDFESAERAYREALLGLSSEARSEPAVAIHLNLANTSSRRGNHDDAAKHYLLAMQIVRDIDGDPYLELSCLADLADAEIRARGQEGARSVLDGASEAVRRGMSTMIGEEGGLQWKARLEHVLAHGTIDDTIELIREAALVARSRHRPSPASRLALAHALFDAGRCDMVVDSLDSLLRDKRAAPVHDEAHVLLAELYAEGRSFGEAARHFNAALTGDVTPRAIWLHAELCLAQRDLASAGSSASKLLEGLASTAAVTAEAIIVMGCIALERGDRETATHHFYDAEARLRAAGPFGRRGLARLLGHRARLATPEQRAPLLEEASSLAVGLQRIELLLGLCGVGMSDGALFEVTGILDRIEAALAEVRLPVPYLRARYLALRAQYKVVIGDRSALAAFDEALALESQAPSPSLRQAMIVGRCQCLIASGNIDTAIVALSDYLKRGSNADSSLAESRAKLGECYIIIGARTTARALIEHAREDFRARGDDANVKHMNAHLAWCAHLDGDFDTAIELAESLVSAFDTGSRPFASVLTTLALAHAAKGDLDTAMRFAIALHDFGDRRIALMAQHRSADHAGLESDQRRNLALAITLALDPAPGADGRARTAFEFVLRRQAISLDLAQHVLVREDDAVRDLAQQLRDVRVWIAQLQLAGDDRLEAAQRRRGELEHRLALRSSPDAVEDWLRSITVDGVLAALAPDEAIVEFHVIEELDVRKPGTDVFGTRARRYVAFAANGKERRVSLHAIGTAEEIGPLVRAVRIAVASGRVRDFGPSPSVADEEDARAWLRDARRLRKMLVGPVAPVLEGAKRVFIAVDGELSSVPFDVLPGEESADRYLCDELDICYVPCARHLLREAPREVELGPSVVLAAPDFDLGVRDAAAMASDFRFRELDGAAEEASRVASLLGVTALTHRDAVESRLRALRSPRVLHIATHGFYLAPPADPSPPDVFEKVHIIEVPGEGQFVVGAERRVPEPPPDPSFQERLRFSGNALLRSGLALAGANASIAGDRVPLAAEDGFLTAEDVSTLDLRGTRVVVLSACETAIGDATDGDGVLGLHRAILAAGATMLLASMWKVRDDETVVFMEHFYRSLIAKSTVSDALREARRALRARGVSPQIWGAFAVFGHGSIAPIVDQSVGSPAQPWNDRDE